MLKLKDPETGETVHASRATAALLRERGYIDVEPDYSEPEPDYSQLKQHELKDVLDGRDIEYPSGQVENSVLIELLVADDEAKEAGTDG